METNTTASNTITATITTITGDNNDHPRNSSTHRRHPSQKVDPIVLALDVIRHADVRVVPLHHPEEGVRDELEVWRPKVVHRHRARVTQRSHDLGEVCGRNVDGKKYVCDVGRAVCSLMY